MKKTTILLLVIISFVFMSASAMAGCITNKRGVSIKWYGHGGALEFTKVRKLTSSFWVTVDLNKKGHTIYSGIPSKGMKVSIPEGTKDVILNISDGQGEVCYSR